jgi:hypothetical protein
MLVDNYQRGEDNGREKQPPSREESAPKGKPSANDSDNCDQQSQVSYQPVLSLAVVQQMLADP